jgi:putative transposase
MDTVPFNPVKHGYVRQLSDWAYSTFEACARRGLYPPGWQGSEGDEVMAGEPRG